MNALAMQSGGCTNVLNRSLYGIASEYAAAMPDGTLYGAPHGLEGILKGAAVNLSEVSESRWRRIAAAPGAAIGSTRRRLRDEDFAPVFDYLAKRDIRHWFIIGGNDSAQTGHALHETALRAGYDLSVINVPKTIDNDLIMTDHCPGYPSAARFVALATLGAGRDAEAMRGASPLTIIEVMGRDAGWLAAAAALAKRDEADAPHVILVPEVPADEDEFLARMEAAYMRYGFAVAVAAENVQGPDGAVIGARAEAEFVDDFGHEYHDGPARRLAALASARIGVRARWEKPGTIQRAFIPAASAVDAREAETAGRAAVQAAREGLRDMMITLVRQDGGSAGYRCETGVAPLAAVGGAVRTLPPEYRPTPDAFAPPAFARYLSPLIGDIPRMERLI